MQQSAQMIFERDGPSIIRMQYIQLQFEDPGFVDFPRSGCFTISSVHGARCSCFDDNASSHCRLPTMFLTAQAQLSRSKYNSGRGRNLGMSKTQERSSNLLSGLAKEALSKDPSNPRVSQSLLDTKQQRLTTPFHGHQTAQAALQEEPSTRPPYKFRPSHVPHTSSRPRPPPDGHAL